MARKRLSPPQETYLAPLEIKGLSSPFASRPPAPIAQIAPIADDTDPAPNALPLRRRHPAG